MASSDEEGEICPDSITNYEFLNQAEQHVSFACLPLVRRKDEVVDRSSTQIYVSGSCAEGLQKIYKQAKAWRYELSYVQPEISVLCEGKQWVKLLKPKRLYEAAFRSLLISIYFLHFVKHNLDATEESLWSHLSRVFSGYEVAPSVVDCMNHTSLIRDAAEHDKTLANSECMLKILSEQPMDEKVRQMEGLPAKRPEFIVNEVADSPPEHDECDNEEELFDTCCSICDNGGELLCCEGRCMRSFHGTIASGEGLCDSLGYTQAQVNAIPSFICRNCRHQQHQCFICGELGSSDISSTAEVFPCIAANCGRFYHPKCVSEELQRRNDAVTEDLEKKITAGESFVCPAHRCFNCKQVEDRRDKDMQFAVCRRCPKSYHRICLPSEIVYDNGSDDESDIFPRAWDNLLPKRVLIYCLDHEIDPDLMTPLRNHLKFPRKQQSQEQPLAGQNALQKKRKLIINRSSAETVVQKKQAEKVLSFKSNSAKLVGKSYREPTSNCQKKSDRRLSLEKPGYAKIPCEKVNAVYPAKSPTKKQGYSSAGADIEMERRISTMMENVNSSFDESEFKKQQKSASMYRKFQNGLDKNLTKGKVEVAVKAIRTALQKLDAGGSVDDAKAVCSPEMLRQIPLWKKKLEGYLGPFLHGMHYSSFGRHFTKLEKLQEIVDRLHCYVQDGDMIVDFCCGANDFSCLMKEKLDSVGKKKCSFKNFDLFPSKNDFNFECKDWFTVNPKDLPHGSKLVMGLNPPFGYKATLANQFINKALLFKPKLLILIVPPETRRLDSRNDGRHYDLLWEDQYLLAGESFYLPGTFDAQDKPLPQWNKITPPLYLWSRPDWTTTHRDIARKCGHSRIPENPQNFQPPTWNFLPKEQQDCHGEFSSLMNIYGDLPKMLDVPEPNDCHGNVFKLNESLVTSNTCYHNRPEFHYPGDILNFENPGTFAGRSAQETTMMPYGARENVTYFSDVNGLEDTEISPTYPPSYPRYGFS